jgi:NCAIR mutase (PurE)-related protein
MGDGEVKDVLRRLQLEELDGRARLDLGRVARRGIPEVVLAAGKSPADTARLVVALAREQGQGLASRLSEEHWRELERAASGLELVRYSNAARVLQPGWKPQPRSARVAVVTAGSSDVPVADEARMVVEACGFETRLVCDVGVAGLHRLIGPLAELLAWGADVMVVCAGMDGVLPGVVSGLVDLPVVGVPVSTGYGAGGKGEAALLTMLQSCSTGLVLVNIDNGVGAGAAAVLIASRVAAARPAARARASRRARAR